MFKTVKEIVYNQNYEAGLLEHIPRGPGPFFSRYRQATMLDVIREELVELEDAVSSPGAEPEVLDALCDIIYSVMHFACLAGYANCFEEAFQEVCASNSMKSIVNTDRGHFDLKKPSGWHSPAQALFDLVVREKRKGGM